MIKDFSKKAATVAIATAGSVAAFGFSGAAQAAQLNANLGFIPMGGATSYAGPNLQNATSVTFVAPPAVSMVNTIPASYLGAVNDFSTGPLQVSLASHVTISPLTFDFSEQDGVPGSGAFTVTFNTAAGVAVFTATSFTKSSASPNTLDLLILGETSGIGFDTSPSQLLSNFNQVGGPPNAVNVSSTFSSPPERTPEPSAILGVLAVAGAGAFARRKS